MAHGNFLQNHLFDLLKPVKKCECSDQHKVHCNMVLTMAGPYEN